MIYGLYQSAIGADLQQMKLDTVSNNIANAGTSSFKRDLAVFSVMAQKAMQQGRPDQIPPGLENHPGPALVSETFTDFSQGSLQNTGSDFDIALLGQGFLRVTDGEQEFLTRRGSLTLNPEAELVQADTGLPVLDENGDPFVVPPGSKLEIDSQGFIAAVDPLTNLRSYLGRLDQVIPADLRALEKRGDSLYQSRSDLLQAGPELQIRQGYLEQSGVNPIREMLSMIETSRAFEANMNLIQHHEQSLGQLLQAIGRN